jgi:microcin C transport system substrate-binding protein
LEHFAKAGFTTRNEDGILINDKGEKLSVTLSTGYEALKDILTILREEALKAGLEFRLEVLDGTSGWKKVQEKKHDIHFSAFGVSLELYPRYWETYASVNAYDVPYLEDGSVNPDRKVKTQTNNLQVIAIPELDALIEQYRHNDDAEEMKQLAFKMEEILHDNASFVPGFVLPFYRVAHWRWLRFPEGFNEKHSDGPNRYFVPWIDEDIKVETRAARKAGETFPPEINVYDQFKED